MKWIQAEDEGLSASRKTHKWRIVSADENRFILGQVKWFGRWRRYCFFPSLIDSLVFEQDCLRDLANFLEDETREHKYKRETRDKGRMYKHDQD